MHLPAPRVGQGDAMTELDPTDRALLERLQAKFPLTPRPFAALAQALGLDEEQVLARAPRLKADGVIRQISAIFDTRRLGYQSTLVAFHVDGEVLEDVAAQVSAHPGVSHNYARPHRYNLWFTLAVPPGQDVTEEVARLARQTGVDDWLNLPAVRVFKIRAHFRLGADHGSRSAADLEGRRSGVRPLTPADIPFVRALQKDLLLVSRPFAGPAGQLGLSEQGLLDRARELETAGFMRRFGAVLRHRRVENMANGMACWVVPEDRIEKAGRRAAQFPQVSHCYHRPACAPRWPYALFTMIHGRSKEEVESVVAEIAQKVGLNRYEVLYSTREFKKERVRYFET